MAELILALDSSGDMLVASVLRVDATSDGVRGVELLASRDHACRRQANVELTGSCLEVLSEAGFAPADVDRVVVGRGPGSFTGVRIAIATAKGFAVGAGVELNGASTLDAVAWHDWCAGVRGKLLVVADAMRGEVYPGLYLLDEKGATRQFEVERVLKARDAIAEYARTTSPAELQLTGDGLRKYRAAFEEAGFSQVLSEELWTPSGEGLVRSFFSPAHVKATGDGDPALVLPIYTRLSDAEETERARLGLATPAAAKVTGVAEALAGRHLQLRPMSLNDAEAAAKLEAAAFAGAAHTSWSAAQFEEEVAAPGRSWWVAHDAGELVGFAGARLAGSDMEVLDVAVAADHRRKHIATRLLARVAYDAQTLNAQTISLEVDEKNAAARATYESLGFSCVGRRPGYYGADTCALIMQVALPLSADAKLEAQAPAPSASIRPWPIVPVERSEGQKRTIAQAGDLILAIESSCDETAMAVVDSSGEICANVVATSVDFHARFGGVVPEIASRKHVEALVGVYEEVMAQAGAHFGVDTLAPSDLAAVGVTAGPGLVGALVVGVAFAKGLCAASNLPLIPVHHLEGHLIANLFETPDLKPPFVASLVSGGNTMLVHVKAWGDYEILGATIDDAVGEAFDKVSKALGLGYPGGPIISKLGANGNPKAIHFPRAMAHSGDFNFSLSGLKTAVITYIEAEAAAGRPINLPDLAASFEAAVVDVQVQKAAAACEQTGVHEFCVGGGVAANPRLRASYRKKLEKRGIRVTVPPMVVCGDNAAMIALVALKNWRDGVTAPLTLDANPNAPLGSWTSPAAPVVGTGWPHK